MNAASTPPPERAAAQARLDAIADRWLAQPDVSWSRMFGSIGLGVRGKIFGVATYDGRLMAKIPEATVAAWQERGIGEPMVMRGREMREWYALPLEAPESDWITLLDEAHAYLDAITPR